MMKKNLILVTRSFPFSIKEASFIIPEMEVLKEQYDITVISRNSVDEQIVTLDDSIKVYRYDSVADYNLLGLGLRAVFSRDFFREIGQLIKTNRLNLRNLKSLVRFITRALHFKTFAQKIRDGITDETVLYTYWNDYSVYSLSKIKRNNDKLVSRIHRIDLYEREENGFYLPMKLISNEKTDLILAVCDEGKQYFENRYKTPNRVEVCRLGVAPQKRIEINYNKPYISVLSFSYLSAVKRVEEIAKTLCLMDGVQIHWKHIGTGDDAEKVISIADNLLKNKTNIKYEFLGAMENKKALEYISDSDFELLINVSASEGLPVTMMEAMSFGIPVVATNVGGVSEIVKDSKNGFLIENDDSLNQSLKSVLLKYSSMSVEEKQELGFNAYKTWETLYNRETNSRELVSIISSI